MNDAEKKSSRAVNLWMVAVFASVFIVYGQTFSFGFVNYDDNVYVYDNATVMSGFSYEGVLWAFSGTHYGNYDPVLWLSYMLDVEWFGISAGPHHSVNVLFHALNSVLLFLLLRGWTGRITMSALAALLFAVHPLHVESVAWISGRKDVLSTFFMLVALGLYTQYTRKPSVGRYGVMMLVFAVGLLSKPMLVTFPLLLLLLDYWPLGRVESLLTKHSAPMTARKLIVEKLPLIALSMGISIATMFGQESAGIMRNDSTFPLTIRATNAGVAYVTYLLQTLWPAKLAPFYLHKGASLSGWLGIGAAAFLVAVSIAVLRLRKKHPYVIFGWAWYLVTLVPVIGLVQVGLQARADRYTYVPLIGIFVIAVWGAPAIASRLRLNRNVVPGFAVCSIGLFALMAWVQTSHWRNSETLWRYTIKVAPENALAHQNLGVYYLEVGNAAEAEVVLLRAAELSAMDVNTRVAIGGPTLNSLGAAASERGDYVQASQYYADAVELVPGNAGYRANLGEALLTMVRLDEAERALRIAVELDSQLARAWNSLAFALVLQRKVDEALDAAAHAVALDPGNPEFRYHIALAEFTAERYDLALKHLDDIFALDDGFEPALALKTEILIRRGIVVPEIGGPDTP